MLMLDSTFPGICAVIADHYYHSFDYYTLDCILLSSEISS